MFEFDAKGALDGVTLYDEFTEKGMRQFTDAPTIAEQVSAIPGLATSLENVKNDLLRGLTAKYGKFSDHATTEKGTQDEWLWLFPSTTLKLAWHHSGDSIDSVFLFYNVRKKSADL